MVIQKLITANRYRLHPPSTIHYPSASSTVRPGAHPEKSFGEGTAVGGRHYRPKRAACHFRRAPFYLLGAPFHFRRTPFYLLRSALRLLWAVSCGKYGIHSAFGDLDVIFGGSSEADGGARAQCAPPLGAPLRPPPAVYRPPAVWWTGSPVCQRNRCSIPSSSAVGPIIVCSRSRVCAP